ncbi:GntR family transcriptional regulator [Paenibacillus chungangensis]|uniref:GntR family transcriptional regulator n=1 Tax=Paenibacillus chungangensis TaxID=696535 RepID=A0ABW3HR76_9BACL
MIVLSNQSEAVNKVDFESGVPLHLQVREIIRKEVENQELVDENGKMPTEAELVERFGVSRVTIRNAMQSLVEEGMFIRERGRGTYLNTNRPENWVGRLMGFTESIREAGFEPGADILRKGMTNQHPEEVRDQMKQRAVWELKRVRHADGIPIAIEQAYYPPEIGIDLEQQDLNKIAIYKYFEDELGIFLKEADQKISAVKAGKEEADILGVELGDPLLHLERISYSQQNESVEYLKALYHPDYYQYEIKLMRRFKQ